MKKSYQQPIIEICMWRTGDICDNNSQVFSSSGANGGNSIGGGTGDQAPKRTAVF